MKHFKRFYDFKNIIGGGTTTTNDNNDDTATNTTANTATNTTTSDVNNNNSIENNDNIVPLTTSQLSSSPPTTTTTTTSISPSTSNIINKNQNITNTTPQFKFINVQVSDSVLSISTKYNMKEEDLMILNRLENKNLYPGQTLIVCFNFTNGSSKSSKPIPPPQIFSSSNSISNSNSSLKEKRLMKFFTKGFIDDGGGGGCNNDSNNNNKQNNNYNSGYNDDQHSGDHHRLLDCVNSHPLLLPKLREKYSISMYSKDINTLDGHIIEHDHHHNQASSPSSSLIDSTNSSSRNRGKSLSLSNLLIENILYIQQNIQHQQYYQMSTQSQHQFKINIINGSLKFLSGSIILFSPKFKATSTASAAGEKLEILFNNISGWKLTTYDKDQNSLNISHDHLSVLSSHSMLLCIYLKSYIQDSYKKNFIIVNNNNKQQQQQQQQQQSSSNATNNNNSNYSLESLELILKELFQGIEPVENESSLPVPRGGPSNWDKLLSQPISELLFLSSIDSKLQNSIYNNNNNSSIAPISPIKSSFGFNSINNLKNSNGGSLLTSSNLSTSVTTTNNNNNNNTNIDLSTNSSLTNTTTTTTTTNNSNNNNNNNSNNTFISPFKKTNVVDTEVHKFEIFYLFDEIRRVEGILTILPNWLIFQANINDPLVKKEGSLKFQLNFMMDQVAYCSVIPNSSESSSSSSTATTITTNAVSISTSSDQLNSSTLTTPATNDEHTPLTLNDLQFSMDDEKDKEKIQQQQQHNDENLDEKVVEEKSNNNNNNNDSSINTPNSLNNSSNSTPSTTTTAATTTTTSTVTNNILKKSISSKSLVHRGLHIIVFLENNQIEKEIVLECDEEDAINISKIINKFIETSSKKLPPITKQIIYSPSTSPSSFTLLNNSINNNNNLASPTSVNGGPKTPSTKSNTPTPTPANSFTKNLLSFSSYFDLNSTTANQQPPPQPEDTTIDLSTPSPIPQNFHELYEYMTNSGVYHVDDEDDDEDKDKENAIDSSVEFVPQLYSVSSVSMIETEDATKLVKYLPPMLQMKNWVLLYKTVHHGISMNTFYSKTKDQGPCLLFIKDSKSRIFGGFVSEDIRCTKSYYGSGECFVFSLKPQEFRCYPWSKKNECFVQTNEHYISMGGGIDGKYALWVDNELNFGVTSPCITYDSQPLTSLDLDQQDFNCIEFEVWGFCS